MKRIFVVLLAMAVSGAAQGLRFWGTWDMTLELLPTLRIYGSNLVLNCSFAPGWRIESETKIYSGGVYKYQNFYVSGSFGDFSVWGKIYFHAEEVRYQKMWLNAEIPLGGGTFRSSFNHWASSADYSSYDRNTFGPWPCVPPVPVVSWEDAWLFITQEVYVTGQVASASMSGGNVYINVGLPYPEPDRFQIFIGSSYVPAFKAVFGDEFWVTWNAMKPTICVRGTIKGYRYTSGGPGGGGYSVAEISLTDPTKLSLGACPGIMVSPTCPGTTIKWFYAKNYNGQTVYIQGPVASITGPDTYYGYPSTYRVRIGGGGTVPNRVEVIMPSHPGWTTAGTSYTNEVCVYGKVTVIDGVAVILLDDLISTSDKPCCVGEGVTYLTSFTNWRFRYTLDPWIFTVDFGDCCTGFSFRRLEVSTKGLPLCCGIFLDATFAFTKSGFEKISFTTSDIPFLCCGMTTKISAEFTPTGKQVELKPSWRGLSGCFTVYGDVDFSANVFRGIEIYGFAVTCYAGDIKLHTITAFNPDKVEDLTDVTFYEGEWEYLGLTYTGQGCCGGNLKFTLETWFGTPGRLFGFQRFKYNFEVPLTPTIVLFTKAQWNLAKASPLEWFDVGWSISF